MLTLVDASEVKTVGRKQIISKKLKKEKENRNKEIDDMINASKIVHISKLTEHL